ncbi:zinc-binding dehydrogenase [Streptacidiphilus sp. PAMC 29251]
MRVIEVHAYGGPEVLRPAERPDPEARPGVVRVRMAATTVNQADLKIRSGQASGRLGELAPPFVLGFDIAGTLIDGAPLLPALRTGGSFVSVTQARIPTAERGIRVTAVRGAPDGTRLREILERLASGKLTTRVAGVLTLEQAAEAHHRTEAGGLPGRLVLTT